MAQLVKNLSASAGDRRLRFHPWVGKIPGEGNGNPLQYSCLENSGERGVWQATLHGVIQFSSIAQSCPTLCNTMNCSTPGLPVHHQLPESTQTHVH